MNQPDPALGLIRDIRKKISREFDNDPKRLVEHYIQTQQKFATRMIGAEDGAKDQASAATPMERRP